jgi:hypothetical protein
MDNISWTERVSKEEVLQRVKEDSKKRKTFVLYRRVIRCLNQACRNPGPQFAVAKIWYCGA